MRDAVRQQRDANAGGDQRQQRLDIAGLLHHVRRQPVSGDKPQRLIAKPAPAFRRQLQQRQLIETRHQVVGPQRQRARRGQHQPVAQQCRAAQRRRDR